MADARLGLGPLPPAPNDYDRVNEQAFRQQMDSLRRSVEQYVASSRNALEDELTAHGISDLADVEITSVADGEVLQYDNASSEWINQTLAEAGIAAASHTHVEADITDLDHYDDADADARIALATLADLATADASELDAGVLADARVQESNVTQHQAALSLTESQISDLAHFSGDAADLTGELADARLSANVPLLDAENVFAGTQEVAPASGGLSSILAFSHNGGQAQLRFNNESELRWIIVLEDDDDDGDNDGGRLRFNARNDASGNLGDILALGRDGPSIGFYGTAPIAKQTGVAVSAAGIHAALVNLGLIAGP